MLSKTEVTSWRSCRKTAGQRVKQLKQLGARKMEERPLPSTAFWCPKFQAELVQDRDCNLIVTLEPPIPPRGAGLYGDAITPCHGGGHWSHFLKGSIGQNVSRVTFFKINVTSDPIDLLLIIHTKKIFNKNLQI